MYLKAIELHGFKSFPDKTRIEFDRGMSAVVGPNGSGKSNISDAIRWVLGETRVSQLRSGGKMEDIIFGGSRSRNPMGFAQVTLVLDNSDHSFDYEGDEISVSRKYYRSGDSEYYINGRKVRLRDIQELFMDTGLGRNGYSMVSQGRVSEIVTSKPEGRREIFEEASGIAKFRFRKNEAERKLEAAQQNIARITDILSELEARVGPLEKESEKAKQFLVLADERKKLEISLWIDTIDRSKAMLREEQRRLEIFQADYDRISEQADEKEKYIEERYLYSNRLLSRSGENTDRIRALENEKAGFASEIRVLESEIGFRQTQMESMREELARFEGEGRNSEEQRLLQQGKIALVKEKLEAKESEIARLEERFSELEKEARESGDRIARLNGRINEIDLRVQQAEIDISALDSRNRAIESGLSSTRESRKNARDYLASTRKQADEIADFINATREELTKNTNMKNGLLMKRNSRAAKLDDAVRKRNENTSSARQIEDRIRILTDLENSLDGFSRSVKTVLSRGKEGRLPGIIGSVAQIISVEKGYETAIEIALGYALQNIVTENEQSAKRAIDYLKQNRAGRATFLPLDTVRPSNFSEKLPEGAITADRVVKVDGRYSGIISNLLGRTVLVEDIDTASRLARKLNYRYRIVTLDGQQVNVGGSFTGGSVAKSAGLFTRKTEIASLGRQLEKLKGEAGQLEKTVESFNDTLDSLDSQLEGYDNEISRLNTEKMEAELEAARLRRSTDQYEKSLEDLDAARKGYEETIASNSQRRQDLFEGQQSDIAAAAILKKQQLEAGSKEEKIITEQNEVSRDISARRLEKVATEGELNLELSNLRTIEETISAGLSRKDRINRDLGEKQAEIDEKNEKVGRIKAMIYADTAKIAEKEQENRDIQKERLEIEAERTTLTEENKSLVNQKEGLSGQIAKTGERIERMERDYDSIIAKLWEEYELTVQTAMPFAVPVEDESEMRRQLNTVRNSIRRLGHVNVGAIEEYVEVSERYTYLKGQYEDLTESRNRLVRLIGSLSAEMQELFGESFKAINENFGRIFTQMFGGGSAKLELTDPDDILSSGIEIKVNPPGKVIKSLSALSGGEQRLVAISIYFAILAHNPSPFCVLDEIEAALDDVNVSRYANYLHDISDTTQFLVITHRRGTMEARDVLYGVTMQEDGISKILKLDPTQLSPSIIN